MKRVLYLTVIYLASIFTGTLVFATLFLLSCNLSMFVTDLSSPFFSLHFFTIGLLISFPIVCILVQVLLILYSIRHPEKHLLSLALYFVFGLLSWLVFIPTDMQLLTKYYDGHDILSARTTAVSSGVFREEENGVFYYSRIDESYNADGLFIDTTGFLDSDSTVLPFFDVPVNNNSAYPYSDVLIKNSLQPPALVKYPLAVYNALLTAAEYSSSLGFLSWLCFATLGLALLSVYGCQFASSWKLANVSLVLAVTMTILFVNYLYYMGIMPLVLKEISSKLSTLTTVKDPLITIINLLITIMFTGFGIFMGIYRLKSSESENKE
ncbi:hypothetical protein [Treponema sp.]|uniref:hypothetical protein n=1 Tax=Treponema sp. TaxID=166 RepID=UPI003890F7CF